MQLLLPFNCDEGATADFLDSDRFSLLTAAGDLQVARSVAWAIAAKVLLLVCEQGDTTVEQRCVEGCSAMEAALRFRIFVRLLLCIGSRELQV